MMKVVFLLLGAVWAAHATYIVTASATCDGIVYPSQCGSFNFGMAQAIANSGFVQVTTGSGPAAHYDSASATFEDDFVLTVTSGLAAGYFLPCVSVSADYFQGGAGAVAQFGNAYAQTVGQGTFGGCSGAQSFILGTPQTLTMSLSASANSGSATVQSAQAGASAHFDGFGFENSAMQPVGNVTYTLTEVGSPGAPEPCSLGLMLSGLLFSAYVYIRRYSLRKRRIPASAGTS